MQPILSLMVDYWWIAPLAGAGYWVYRLAGWRGLVTVGTLGLAGALWTQGRRYERQKAAEAAERRRQKALEDRNRVDDEVANLNPDDRRKRLDRWMRDN